MDTRVLVIGAGGLGSPVLLYLAASGIGILGIVDYDVVDKSNLQRQIMHSQQNIGLHKCDSAKNAILALNPRCQVNLYKTPFLPENGIEIAKDYDIIVDASDNAPTRYLINDTAVILNKPLISASALKTEGQLTVYNFEGGPCYRCLFPVPPPASTVTNCSEGGVLGCIVGILGSMQALEVIKVALKLYDSEKFKEIITTAGKMIIFSGFQSSIRTIKLRPRSKNCIACGDNGEIKDLNRNYEEFCGSKACDGAASLSLLKPNERLSCQQYNEIRHKGEPHIIIDVRPALQYEICALKNSVNIPLENLSEEIENIKRVAANKEIFFICRRGNRSQKAVQLLKNNAISSKDIIGGLRAWSTEVDEDFPVY